ncbi:hypothetical protein L798_14948 [Zootermopsis nevadensis]|uniref:Uncharacterized protein n=1 Tax=Zootermopsis nevadensis TaxID=136037 RepID=A0A067R172_ZOONE|nr:hypothetical protein L798_14948 [Zootermopsis nevadensis]
MKPSALTLLSSAVLIGVAVAVLADAAPSSTRLGEDEKTFLRPVVHRKRENHAMRSGIRTGRSGLLDSRQQRRRRLIRPGDHSSGRPETQREFAIFVPAAEHGPFVRQSRRIKGPQRKMDNSVDTWIKDDSGVMAARYGMNGDKSDVYYCPYCRQDEAEHYRLIPYHRFASSGRQHQSHPATNSSRSPVPAETGHVKHDPDLQKETTVMSGEQRGKGLVPEEGVEMRSKSIEFGSAEDKESGGGYDEDVVEKV